MNLIAIGTSSGGIAALQLLLGGLSESFQTPIAIVQHIPDQARVKVEMLFSASGKFKVLEVEDKMPIEHGYIYVAPPGYHLLAEKEGHFALNMDEPVNYSRPSIDLFFDSVARAYGRRSIGILLTGANSDGAAGLANIKKYGGVTMVQDPQTAESPTMPASALDLFQPSFVLPISGIAKILSNLEGGIA